MTFFQFTEFYVLVRVHKITITVRVHKTKLESLNKYRKLCTFFLYNLYNFLADEHNLAGVSYIQLDEKTIQFSVISTFKCMALRSRAMFVHRTLEIDSGQKNKKIGFYAKSLRSFLRILCVVDDSHIHM